MGDIRPDVQAYLAAAQAPGGPSIVDLEPATARAMLAAAGGMADLPARDMPRTDVTVAAADGFPVPARVYHAGSGAGARPVLVFFHGGGWVLGDIAGYDSLCSEIAHQMGMTVVSVGYRLAPEDRFPAAVDDCLAVSGWAAEAVETIGHAISGLIFAGDSAGGALAAVAARELRDDLPVPVLAQWLMYPVTDLSRNYPSDDELSAMFNLTDEGKMRFYRHYLGDEGFQAGLSHPWVSPLLATEWDGLAPAVVMSCALDPLRDQGRAYAAKLIEHGVPTLFQEAQGQVHACLTMRKMLPSAQQDLLEGLAALRVMLTPAG